MYTFGNFLIITFLISSYIFKAQNTKNTALDIIITINRKYLDDLLSSTPDYMIESLVAVDKELAEFRVLVTSVT